MSIATVVERQLPPIPATARAQRRAVAATLAEIGDAVALVGLHLPVDSQLQDDIGRILAAFDVAVAGTAAGRRWGIA